MKKLRLVTPQKQNPIIKWFKDKKQAKINLKKQMLENYFSCLYSKLDGNGVEIPCFMKAKTTVKDLIEKGLFNDVYNHIKKRGVAC